MSRLYYKTESGWDWNKALPVGNGRLGAMVFGNKTHEKLQLNEDTMWFGGPIDRINKDAKPNLEKVRSLILSGKIKETLQILNLRIIQILKIQILPIIKIHKIILILPVFQVNL